MERGAAQAPVHGFAQGREIAKITALSELQLKDPFAPSFHASHKHSCYIFVGGLDNRLTEGDVIAVFSQWGQVVDIDLIRHKETGESRGFGFLAYEDQRSTVLAVDNANGMRLLNRTLKVDHVNDYRKYDTGEEEAQPRQFRRNEKDEIKREQHV